MKRFKKLISLSLSFFILFNSFVFFPNGAYASSFNPSIYGNPDSLMELMPKNQDQLEMPNPVQGIKPEVPIVPTDHIRTQIQSMGNKEANQPRLGGTKEHFVDVTTGYLTLSESDISLPGIGFDLDFTRSYSSDNQDIGPFGLGWSFKTEQQEHIIL